MEREKRDDGRMVERSVTMEVMVEREKSDDGSMVERRVTMKDWWREE